MRQHVIVVPSDNLIIVDGISLFFDFPVHFNMHALQWHEGAGHIEIPGQANKTLTTEDYDTFVAPYVASWEQELARLEAEQAAAEEEYNKPENVQARKVAAAQSDSANVVAAYLQESVLQTADFKPEEYALFALAEMYPQWKPNTNYVANQRIQYEGIVYKVVQNVYSLEHQKPGSEGRLAIYSPLCNSYDDARDGSRSNPYIFFLGMEVTEGKYYQYNGTVYVANAYMNPCVWAPGTAGVWQWAEVS